MLLKLYTNTQSADLSSAKPTEAQRYQDYISNQDITWYCSYINSVDVAQVGKDLII